MAKLRALWFLLPLLPAIFAVTFLLFVVAVVAGVSGSQSALASGQSFVGSTIPTGAAVGDIPTELVPVYQSAGAKFGVDWSVVAAIGSVESNHGRSTLPGVHSGENYAGAGGPMQFLAGTWAQEGVDGGSMNGSVPSFSPDGVVNRYDSVDAIFSTANYLHHSGAPGNYHDAIWLYNHAEWYVNDVLSRAARYRAALAQVATTPVSTTGPTAGYWIGALDATPPLQIPFSNDPSGGYQWAHDIAQAFGLAVGSTLRTHTDQIRIYGYDRGSAHLTAGGAADIAPAGPPYDCYLGDPHPGCAEMERLMEWAARSRIFAEAFYDPVGQWDNGLFSRAAIGGHRNHVHLSYGAATGSYRGLLLAVGQ